MKIFKLVPISRQVDIYVRIKYARKFDKARGEPARSGITIDENGPVVRNPVGAGSDGEVRVGAQPKT